LPAGGCAFFPVFLDRVIIGEHFHKLFTAIVQFPRDRKFCAFVQIRESFDNTFVIRFDRAEDPVHIPEDDTIVFRAFLQQFVADLRDHGKHFNVFANSRFFNVDRAQRFKRVNAIFDALRCADFVENLFRRIAAKLILDFECHVE